MGRSSSPRQVETISRFSGGHFNRLARTRCRQELSPHLRTLISKLPFPPRLSKCTKSYFHSHSEESMQHFTWPQPGNYSCSSGWLFSRAVLTASFNNRYYLDFHFITSTSTFRQSSHTASHKAPNSSTSVSCADIPTHRQCSFAGAALSAFSA